MAPKPPSSDDQNLAPADDPELEKKLVIEALEAAGVGKAAGAPPGDDKDNAPELDDDDDDEDLVVFTAKEAASGISQAPGTQATST